MITIKIKTTRLALTKALEEYIVTKVNMLEKYLGVNTPVINCDFEIEKTVGGQSKGNIFRAELNLQVPGELLRVEKTESDMYKAIDKVKDHMILVIKKYKEKSISKKRRASRRPSK